MSDAARTIARLDRQICRHKDAAAALQAERRQLRQHLRDVGTSWAAIGAISGVSPAAIQKDLQDDAQRARHNEAKNAARRKTPEPADA